MFAELHSGARPGAAVQRLPEPVVVGPLTAPEHGLGVLPSIELAEDLERLIHHVRSELSPERVPAPAPLRLETGELHGLPPPPRRHPIGGAFRRVLRVGKHERIPDPPVPPARFGERRPNRRVRMSPGGAGRASVARTCMFAARVREELVRMGRADHPSMSPKPRPADLPAGFRTGLPGDFPLSLSP